MKEETKKKNQYLCKKAVHSLEIRSAKSMDKNYNVEKIPVHYITKNMILLP